LEVFFFTFDIDFFLGMNFFFFFCARKHHQSTPLIRVISNPLGKLANNAENEQLATGWTAEPAQ
jgi:hypothetical protein